MPHAAMAVIVTYYSCFSVQHNRESISRQLMEANWLCLFIGATYKRMSLPTNYQNSLG